MTVPSVNEPIAFLRVAKFTCRISSCSKITCRWSRLKAVIDISPIRGSRTIPRRIERRASDSACEMLAPPATSGLTFKRMVTDNRSPGSLREASWSTYESAPAAPITPGGSPAAICPAFRRHSRRDLPKRGADPLVSVAKQPIDVVITLANYERGLQRDFTAGRIRDWWNAPFLLKVDRPARIALARNPKDTREDVAFASQVPKPDARGLTRMEDQIETLVRCGRG